jgi:hypothetical protein
MKKSMKMAVGIVSMLFTMTGFCFGQQEKDTKKTNSNSERVVEGYPIIEKIKTEGKGITNSQLVVAGYPVSEKDPVKIQRSRTLTFKNESKKAEVKVNMTEEYNLISFRILSNIDKGSVVIEIIDPKGEKQGTCTVKSDDTIIAGENTWTEEHVIGEITKDFRYPLNGEWIIRVVPAAATGSVQIEIMQQYLSHLAR